MADDTTPSFTPGRQEGRRPGMRQGGAKEPGGFRIRLSDNEMQAARALQEAFGLRSTVAVLGFALRTMAEQLEQGQLSDLVTQHRAQAGAPSDTRPRRGEPRGNRAEGRDGARHHAPKVDPFARPSKPVPPPPEVEPEPEPDHQVLDGSDASDAAPLDTTEEESIEAASPVASEINDPTT